VIQSTISVVLAVKNEEHNIARCLKSIKSQSYAPIDIIVVDNGSTDMTKDIALSFTSSVYDIASYLGGTAIINYRGAQINYGVLQATGDIIFYPDADMTFDKDLLKNSLQCLKNADALYIPEVICGTSLFNRTRNFERSFYNQTPIDAVRFVKKNIFNAVNGFDETRIEFGFDDWDFNKKLKNKKCNFSITNVSLYHHEEDLSLNHYIKKKNIYFKGLHHYIKKWGNKDEDIIKQTGFFYRAVSVFVEKGKWRKILRHPLLFVYVVIIKCVILIKLKYRNINEV